jgi:hypothetical protein
VVEKGETKKQEDAVNAISQRWEGKLDRISISFWFMINNLIQSAY